MLIQSPVLISERHDTSSNIRNLLSSASSLYLKPVLMKYYKSKESLLHWILIRGVTSWIRIFSSHMNCHECDIHDGVMHFLGCGGCFQIGLLHTLSPVYGHQWRLRYGILRCFFILRSSSGHICVSDIICNKGIHF